MRLADTVELMLQETILTFRDGDEGRRVHISRLDDEVDRLQEAIKLYLTRLTRQPLDEEDTRRCFDLILFITNLEHVGDIIDRGPPRARGEAAAQRRRRSRKRAGAKSRTCTSASSSRCVSPSPCSSPAT